MAKYTVEKFNTDSIFPYFVGGINKDVLCTNAEDCQLIVDALNFMTNFKKIKRKTEILLSHLEEFSQTDCK